VSVWVAASKSILRSLGVTVTALPYWLMKIRLSHPP
jgi:hypothetical protein